MMKLWLRPLGLDDIEYLRILRNRHRAAFFHNRLLTRRAQHNWFYKTYCTSLDHHLFSINTPIRGVIGFIGIKWLHGYPLPVYEVGNLLLDDVYQGRGIMARSLTLLRRHFPDCLIVAHVRQSNQASLRLFEGAGFWQVPQRPTKGAN